MNMYRVPDVDIISCFGAPLTDGKVHIGNQKCWTNEQDIGL